MTSLFPPTDECITKILGHIEKIRAESLLFRGNKIPTPQQLSMLVESAFWASLRANEGRPTRARLALIEPERFGASTVFATAVDCDEGTIAKLSPALPQDYYLGVTMSDEATRIWGFVHRANVRYFAIFSMQIVEPGVLRVDIGPFRPFAILDGRSNVTQASVGLDLAYFLEKRLSKLTPSDDIVAWQTVRNECLAFAELVRAVLAQGHGGAILIVPEPIGEWSKSLNPFLHRLKSPDNAIPDFIRKELEDYHQHGTALLELEQASVNPELKARIAITSQRNYRSIPYDMIRSIASLLEVDGALVVSRDLTLLGFGAKIQFGKDAEVPICIFAPATGPQDVPMRRLEDTGGMRHQSAARFVFANRDSFAIVESQDRHVSLMYWGIELNVVSVVRNAEWWV